MQFVTLYRGGEKVAMSTRAGEFVTLRELRSEVGNDAARFFYVMRSNDQHLDFDLELAKSHSQRQPGLLHPVRARARLQRDAPARARRAIAYDAAQRPRVTVARSPSRTSRRCSPRSAAIRKSIELAALQRAPHTLVHYLRDLANDFHTYYNAHTVHRRGCAAARCAADAGSRAASRSIANGLALLGVSAPETM